MAKAPAAPAAPEVPETQTTTTPLFQGANPIVHLLFYADTPITFQETVDGMLFHLVPRWQGTDREVNGWVGNRRISAANLTMWDDTNFNYLTSDADVDTSGHQEITDPEERITVLSKLLIDFAREELGLPPL